MIPDEPSRIRRLTPSCHTQLPSITHEPARFRQTCASDHLGWDGCQAMRCRHAWPERNKGTLLQSLLLNTGPQWAFPQWAFPFITFLKGSTMDRTPRLTDSRKAVGSASVPMVNHQ